MLRGNRDDSQLDVGIGELLLDQGRIVDDPLVDGGTDGQRVAVEHPSDVKLLLIERAVGKQGASDVARSDQRRIPGTISSEDPPQVVVQGGHRVTDSGMAELSYKGEVLAHLGVGIAEGGPELSGAHGRLFVEGSTVPQFAEVEAEPPCSGAWDLGFGFHGSSLPIVAYNAAMHFKDVYQSKDTTFSFEFFPPSTSKGWSVLEEAISKLVPLNPDFVSVTYGAGGSTRDKTHELVLKLKGNQVLDPIPHLTCVEHNEMEIQQILERYARAGVSNILALRGDVPVDSSSAHPFEHFAHASDLVRTIKQFNESGSHSDSRGFGISIAGFPEGHPETPNTLTQMDHLKAKADMGADVVFTQLFFDNNAFFDWRDRCTLAGIDLPIVAGIMPIVSMQGLNRMAELAAGTRFPASLLRALERGQDDPEAVKRIGTHWATEQCLDLLDKGVSGIHFYTLNKSEATLEVFKTLGMKSA